MSSIQEVVPGIFRIKQTINRFKFSVNVYVIAGHDGLVFDSGFGSRRAGNGLVRGIKRISSQVRDRGEVCRISCAMASHGHGDHFSGLAHLQTRLGLEILATENQALKFGAKENYRHFFWEEQEMLQPQAEGPRNAWRKVRNHLINELLIKLFRIRFVPGEIIHVRDHQRLSINGQPWEVIPVPGHCDDDIVLFNRATGVLLGGDLVLRTVTTWLGPMKSDLGLYLKSLERIKRLPGLKMILPAHGSPITNPCERIQAAIDHRKKRTDEVRQLVVASGDKGLSFKGLYARIYPGKQFQRGLLGGWIVVTLKYLLDRGEIVFVKKGRKIIFLSG